MKISNQIDWDNLDLPTDEEIREETRRELIRQTSQGRWEDQEYKSRVSEKIAQTYSTDDMREMQRQKFLGKQVSENVKQRLREHNLGKKRPGAWIQKMAQTKIGNTNHCKPFQTPSGAFASKKLAIDWATEQGVINAYGKLGHWLKTKPTEFYYISQEQYELVKDIPHQTGLPWMQNSKKKTTNTKV